ncbi:hypothetical protein [Halorientalis persicus]|uniref:hypothetical protein n=1 Tax=Halorientalis persicus TaxID=1367881 RepID=UPI000B8462DA|nr:hypothetical protein [Halorientalis persicus]
MSEDNDKRVNLVVSEEQKEEWDNAVEESTEYSSLSHLIRQSVTHELSDSAGAATAPNGRETQQTAQTEAHTEALEQITDTLENMESTLSDLDSRLTAVEREVTASAQADLKQQIFDELPEGESASAREIAEEIGADREKVSHALSRLEEQTGMVKVAANIDGQQFYTREGDE